MPNSNRFIDERLAESITSLVQPASPIDQAEPLSFIEWLKFNGSLYTNADEFLNRYQSYVNNWHEKKNELSVSVQDLIKKTYTDLINEIIVTYASSEEKRFLKNLDFSSNRDLAIAVPFFAKKIKDICLYYSTLRDDVKSAQLRYNLKGSNFGIEKLVYNEISKSLEADDLTEFVRTLNLSLSDIRNNLVIDIEDIFDSNPYYLDLSPTQPFSAYGSNNGTRKEYFNYNTYDINSTLFLDFNSAIVQAISSYPVFLIELGTNNLSIDFRQDATQTNFLKDSDFINTINDGSTSNLNLNLEKALTTKYIGTEFFYLSTGSTSSNFTSGSLFTPDNNFANYLNKRFPSVAAIPSTEFIKTAKQVGLFFKPDKLGVSTFQNFGNIYSVSTTLSANTIYIFPNPEEYGNISSITNENFKTPLEFRDNCYLLKVDFANQYSFGDVKSDSYLQTFRGYQGREQTLDYPVQGLARYSDPQDFFKGEFKTVWGNKDIFPLIPANLFPIDNRIDKLFSLNKTLIQYKTDVYGNEYSLYKNIFPKKFISPEILRRFAPSTTFGDEYTSFRSCLLLDGHILDPDFNYDIEEPNQRRSGVTFRTVPQIPPGSGSFIDGYNSATPTFLLSGNPVPIVSYRMQPEIFCSGVVNVNPTFNCFVYDGLSFTAPGGIPLIDVSSDNPDFDSATSDIYYSILVDAGVSPTNPPTYRPNFANAASFTFKAPSSAYSKLDGFFYIIDGSEPCGTSAFSRTLIYTEKSNLLEYKVPYRFTEGLPVGETLTSKKSLYDTKFKEYGQLYIRNSNGSILSPASAALSSVYIKYDSVVSDEINNKLINIDVFYDVICFETENNIIFEKIIFNFDTNIPSTTTKSDSFLSIYENKNLQKFSTVWFNEKTNKAYFSKTVLYPQLSATNYKIIYPEIYEVDIALLTVNKIYPTKSSETLTFNDLLEFSLFDKTIELNIVEINKPIMSYDDESSTYTITYIAKDIAKVIYIFKIYFKYINGVMISIDSFMHKFDTDVQSVNFASPLPLYKEYSVTGQFGFITNGIYYYPTS